MKNIRIYEKSAFMKLTGLQQGVRQIEENPGNGEYGRLQLDIASQLLPSSLDYCIITLMLTPNTEPARPHINDRVTRPY